MWPRVHPWKIHELRGAVSELMPIGAEVTTEHSENTET